MKKSIDFKNKLKFSNYILGKVFVAVLCVLSLALIYNNTFQSLNFYSVLIGILLISAIGYKFQNILSSSLNNLSLSDQLEIAALSALFFAVLLEISGNQLFPLSYLIIPLTVLAFGWPAGVLSFVIVSVLQVTQFPNSSLAFQIIGLFLSTFILGFLLKGNKINLRSDMLRKNSENKRAVQSTLHSSMEDQSGESDNIKALRSDINKALEILGKLVQSHSILFYMRMDDGLYIIADYISNSADFIDQGQRVSFRSGYLGWVLKTKTPVLITSIKNIRQNLIYYTKDIPVKSLYAAPLLMKSEKEIPDNKREVVGVLILDSMQKNVFGEKEKLIVSLISERIGEIIDRFQLSEQAKLSTRELNSFYDFTQKLYSSDSVGAVLDHIVQTISGAMDSDLVGVVEFNEDEGESVLMRVSDPDKNHLEGNEIPYSDNLIWLVHEGKNYFHTDDLSARTKYKSIFGKEIDFALSVKNIKSVLIYPLIETIPEDHNQESAVLGSIIVARRDKIPFDESEIGLVKVICSEAAKFIKTSQSLSKIEDLSFKDSLTGLYNQSYFREIVPYTIARSDEYDEKASLILLDLDNLKYVNDQYGHQAGDSVLSLVGKVLNETLRSVDVSSRYGGDEFAVIIPGANRRDSLIAAQKIQDNISSMPFKFKGEELRVTLSIGIATYPDNAPDTETLIEKAERALHESKNQGKEKVVHFKDIALEEIGTQVP